LLATFVKLAEAESSSGLEAFNLNLKSFGFQLITFIIVLLIIKRWVLPPLTKTLEERRQTLEKSLVQAKQTEETLARAEEQAGTILHKTREQADVTIAEAKNQAREVLSKAEVNAQTQAQRILKEAEVQLAQERAKLRDELKVELAGLVTEATEKVLKSKLSAAADRQLIERSIKELAR